MNSLILLVILLGFGSAMTYELFDKRDGRWVALISMAGAVIAWLALA